MSGNADDAQSYNAVVRRTTVDYLHEVDESVSLIEMERELVSRTRSSLMQAKVTSPRGIPKVLEPWQAAMIVVHSEVVRLVKPRQVGPLKPDEVLVIWPGPEVGIHVPLSGIPLQEIVRQVNPTAARTWTAEFLVALGALAERVDECADADLVPLANGVYDYRRRILRPYGVDNVFLTKAAVALPPVEPDVPQIGGGIDLDAASWLGMLAPDDEVQGALIQLIGAALRWNVSWNLLPILVSPAGGSADVVAAMIRAMVGDTLVGAVPLARLADPPGWKLLSGKVANMPSRGQASKFPQDAYRLSAAMGAVPGRGPILNVIVADNLPPSVNTDPDLLQRLLVIPLEEPNIGKDESVTQWLCSREVLEWLVYEALVMMPPCDQLDMPEPLVSARELLARSVDPVAAFWDEYGDKFGSIFLPFSMLFAAYQAWHSSVFGMPAGGSQQGFTRHLKRIVRGTGWGTVPGGNGKDKEFRVRKWFHHLEPALKELPRTPELARWIGTTSGGLVPQFSLPADCPPKDRGLVRLDEYRSHTSKGAYPVGNP